MTFGIDFGTCYVQLVIDAAGWLEGTLQIGRRHTGRGGFSSALHASNMHGSDKRPLCKDLLLLLVHLSLHLRSVGGTRRKKNMLGNNLLLYLLQGRQYKLPLRIHHVLLLGKLHLTCRLLLLNTNLWLCMLLQSFSLRS